MVFEEVVANQKIVESEQNWQRSWLPASHAEVVEADTA
jgi:hypothetical protein